MTQAQFAGGTADAPQACPAKGQLIRDFTLPSALGQPISLSDYRGRSNLVLLFVGGGAGPGRKLLAEAAAAYPQLQEEQAEVLAIVQCGRDAAARIARQAGLPFPVLADEDGRVHRSAGAVARDNDQDLPPAVYITDTFAEVFAVFRTADSDTMPNSAEMVKWLGFVNMQCPECGHPEWLDEPD